MQELIVAEARIPHIIPSVHELPCTGILVSNTHITEPKSVSSGAALNVTFGIRLVALINVWEENDRFEDTGKVLQLRSLATLSGRYL